MYRRACFAVVVVVFSFLVAQAVQAAGPFQYQSVTPCRLFDTRNNTGGAGTAPKPNPGPHTFRVREKCSVPLTAKAVSINVTVITPTTGGDLRLFPSDGLAPNVAVMSYNAGEPALCNGAILPLAVSTVGDDIALVIGMACGGNGCGSIHMTMDVTGFFQ